MLQAAYLREGGCHRYARALGQMPYGRRHMMRGAGVFEGESEAVEARNAQRAPI